jgi:hypothetical protein
MNTCPDCKNEFLQQFVCTTCGAEKLYDATVATLRNQLAAALKQRDKAVDALKEKRRTPSIYSSKWERGKL